LGKSFKLSQTPVEGCMVAPLLGEHPEYVCFSIILSEKIKANPTQAKARIPGRLTLLDRIGQ